MRHDQALNQLELLQQAPGFLCFLRGPRLTFELANAAYLQLIGHRDVLGRPVREALPEVEGQGFFELLDQVYATGEPYVGNAMPVMLQREPRSLLTQAFVDFIYQPIRDEAGRVEGVLVKVRSLPREAGGELPVVALTAYARPEDRTRALLLGFTTHLPKPVEPLELLAVVASLSGRTRKG